jgi:hypothetical protein
MTSMLKLVIAVSAIIGFVSSLPPGITGRQSWASGTLNNSQEFYISMAVTDGPTAYEG